MAAEFPTSSKEFTTKQDGVDKIYASHVNDIQDEVMALEQALLGEILDGNVQYVKKAATSTDNAIPRFDGTDGKKLQNSGVTIDDTNNIMVGEVPIPTSVATSTDNAIPRFDGVDGKKLQNSGVTIDDTNNIMAGAVPVPTSVATSTDNAVVRFDGTDGKKIQNSGVTIDDSNNIMVGSAPVPTSVATSTDNAVPRFDGTDGKKIQNSGVIINDNGQLSGNGLDGWIYDTDTWSYVSATSFKVSGKDVRYKFPKGTKIKLVQSGSTKYFYVTAATFSTDTTVTVTGGSDYTLASATISGQAYSYAAVPQNFPQWFNYTPTIYTGWSALPTGNYMFQVIGNTCFYDIDISDGTSNGQSTELGIPILTVGNLSFGSINALAVDDGIVLTVPSRWLIGLDPANNRVQFYKDMGSTKFTASGTKRVRAMIIYIF